MSESGLAICGPSARSPDRVIICDESIALDDAIIQLSFSLTHTKLRKCDLHGGLTVMRLDIHEDKCIANEVEESLDQVFGPELIR